MDVLRSFETGRRFRFNPYAFFLGLFWLLYRKMYLTTFTVLLLTILSTFVEDLLYENYIISTNTYNSLDTISRVLWASILGFLANKFYEMEANWKISKVLSKNLSDQETTKKIAKVGGTTLIPHLIIVVIIGVAMLLFHMGYLDNYW